MENLNDFIDLVWKVLVILLLSLFVFLLFTRVARYFGLSEATAESAVIFFGITIVGLLVVMIGRYSNDHLSEKTEVIHDEIDEIKKLIKKQ